MISLENVTVAFGENTVLNSLSLDIPDTGITCLSGPSGCGKTTLLRVIAKLQPYTGSVSGTPERVSFMFQEDRLLPWLSAEGNVRASLPRERAGDALLWLSRVGLQDFTKKLPRELSGGMCRRVSLARALAFGGDLLLLDEPFKGADKELTERLTSLVRNFGAPAIIATHSEEEVALLGADVLRFSGPPLLPAK